MAQKMQNKSNLMQKATGIFVGAAMLIGGNFTLAKLPPDTLKTDSKVRLMDTVYSKDSKPKTGGEVSKRRHDTLYSKNYPPLPKKEAIKGIDTSLSSRNPLQEQIIKIDTSNGFIQLNDTLSYNPTTGEWKNPSKK